MSFPSLMNFSRYGRSASWRPGVTIAASIVDGNGGINVVGMEGCTERVLKAKDRVGFAF